MAVQPTVAGGAPSRDIWSDLGNVVGGIFGIPQEQAAHNAQQNAAQQQALATQYGGSAANIYGGLATQGQQQSSVYNNNYLNLLNQYAGLSGLGNNPINTRPTAGGAGQPGPGGVPGQGNLAQTLNSQPGQGPQQAGPNPYQLDPNQQALLNQSNAQIANSAKQAQAQFIQHMNAQGITDPRALQVGQEQLQEHFTALQQETQAKFYEQVKQDKQQALQQILAGLGQYGQQGIGEQEAAGSGYLGLAQGAQAFSNQQQNVALQQSQNSQAQIDSLIQFAGGAAGGAFSPASASAGFGGVTGTASASAGVTGANPFQGYLFPTG